MWAGCAAIDWASLHRKRRRRLALPTYPFEHKVFRRVATTEEHSLLGRLTATRKGVEFRKRLLPELCWVRDHQAHGVSVLAGAAILEMARAGAEQLEPRRRVRALRDVT